MSQCEAIIQHLEAGNTITPAEAYSLCGSLALHSRIAELRAKGYRIDSEMKFKDGKRYGEYRIAIPF